jgi:hypothetical protein
MMPRGTAIAYQGSVTRRQIRAIEELSVRLAADRSSDASLAALARLLDALARRRRLRREASLLAMLVFACNLVAALRFVFGVDEARRGSVTWAWLAVMLLSVVALVRLAAIRKRLRSLSENVEALVADLRWLYSAL